MVELTVRPAGPFGDGSGVSRAWRATALYGAGCGKPRRTPPSPLRGLGPVG
jgi:hypothetical protein